MSWLTEGTWSSTGHVVKAECVLATFITTESQVLCGHQTVGTQNGVMCDPALEERRGQRERTAAIAQRNGLGGRPTVKSHWQVDFI